MHESCSNPAPVIRRCPLKHVCRVEAMPQNRGGFARGRTIGGRRNQERLARYGTVVCLSGNVYDPVLPDGRSSVLCKHPRLAYESLLLSAPATQHPNLLPRIAAGDAAATREFIARYGGLIWSLARRFSLSGADAEDAVQEVFIELWRNAARFDASIASETSFVAMISRRRLIDRKRRLSRRPDQQELSEFIADGSADSWRGTVPQTAASGSTVATAAHTEDTTRAARALDDLTIDQQRVLRLSILRGLSHEAISQSLDIPLGTVKTHARRGLMRLRELLGGGRSSTQPLQPSTEGGRA